MLDSPTLSMPTLLGDTSVAAWQIYESSWKTSTVKLKGKSARRGGYFGRGRGRGNQMPIKLCHKTKQNISNAFIFSFPPKGCHGWGWARLKQELHPGLPGCTGPSTWVILGALHRSWIGSAAVGTCSSAHGMPASTTGCWLNLLYHNTGLHYFTCIHRKIIRYCVICTNSQLYAFIVIFPWDSALQYTHRIYFTYKTSAFSSPSLLRTLAFAC